MKKNLGPGVYVGKYDIPHTNIKAPFGTSIFQLQKEREFAEQNEVFLNKKYMDNVKKQGKKLTPLEKRPPAIDEPKPSAGHVICAICREQFKDYYQHIFSARHKRGVQANISTFAEIDKVILGVADRQAQKQEEYVMGLLNKCSEKNH